MSPMPCSPEERWVFHAFDKGKGKTMTRFRCVRPWDPNHPAGRVLFRVKIHR